MRDPLDDFFDKDDKQDPWALLIGLALAVLITGGIYVASCLWEVRP